MNIKRYIKGIDFIGEDSRHTVDSYIKDILRYPLLTKEEEKDLAAIIQTSTDAKEVDKAIERMVTANLRLVVYIATKEFRLLAGLGDCNVSFSDTIQDGNIALVNAAKNYCPSSTCRFATYATIAIIRQIRRSAWDSRFIKLPANHYSKLGQIKQLKSEFGEDIDDDFMVEKLHISKAQLESLKKDNVERQKDSTIDIDYITEHNLIQTAGVENPSVTDKFDREAMRKYLLRFMGCLSQRQRDYIRTKYYGGRELEHVEVAKIHKVSKQCVHQAFARACDKLRGKIKDEIMKNKEATRELSKAKDSKSFNRRCFELAYSMPAKNTLKGRTK